MERRILWPYFIGSGNRPIPYLFQEIARYAPEKYDITYFSVDNVDVGHSPVHSADYNTWRGRSTGLFTSLKKYDLIQTGGVPKAHLPFAIAARARNRSISHIHTFRVDVDPESEFDTRIRKILGIMADECTAVSQHTARTVEEHFGINCHVIYNGVNINRFNPNTSGKKLIERGQYEYICAFVGSLTPRKRPHDVIQVAKNLPNVKFLIIGDGELRKNILEETKNLDNINVVGEVPKEKLESIYPHLDSLIFPSVQEGCPNVVLESLACGTPVVGYRATSMPELIKNRKTGMLVELGDTTQLTQALETILEDNSLSTNAREYAIKNHSFKTIAKKYYELYEDII